MKYFKVLFLFLTTTQSSFAQQNTIPDQYESVQCTYGDLNEDGIPEKVVVYNVDSVEDENDGVNREIIIFKRENEKWAIWHRSLSAVGNSKDGGMMGDPFGSIEIMNGVLSINQSGGSSWKWSTTDKYRYQNNSLELIGYTSYFGKLCEYQQDVDFNLTTGKIIINKEYERCEEEKGQVIYKKENEVFMHKLKQKVVLENRKEEEIKIVSPKYKHDIYL